MNDAVFVEWRCNASLKVGNFVVELRNRLQAGTEYHKGVLTEQKNTMVGYPEKIEVGF